MTTAPTELDPDTRRRLADEVEQLVRMGTDRKAARRIVWDDYLEELAAYATPPPVVEPEPEPSEPPVPATKPIAERIDDSHAEQAVTEAQFFTPERLQRNRAELAKVKRLVGLRS